MEEIVLSSNNDYMYSFDDSRLIRIRDITISREDGADLTDEQIFKIITMYGLCFSVETHVYTNYFIYMHRIFFASSTTKRKYKVKHTGNSISCKAKYELEQRIKHIFSLDHMFIVKLLVDFIEEERPHTVIMPYCVKFQYCDTLIDVVVVILPNNDDNFTMCINNEQKIFTAVDTPFEQIGNWRLFICNLTDDTSVTKIRHIDTDNIHDYHHMICADKPLDVMVFGAYQYYPS